MNRAALLGLISLQLVALPARLAADAHYRTIADRASRGLVGQLRRYRAITIDVGDQDRLQADAGKLHDALDRYGVANQFEVCPGTHTSKVADRFQNHVMRFFGRNLCFDAGCR
jgi:hypothetical protein